MRTNFAVAGLLALTLSGCAMDDSIYGADAAYYGDGYYDYGYAPYSGYYPPYSGVFYGSIFVGGSWYDGPHRYRDGRLGREYWFRNGWHRAQIHPSNNDRGPRNNFGPGQWQDRNPQGNGSAVNPPPRNPGRGNRQGNRPRTDANAQAPAPNPPPVARGPSDRGDASPRIRGSAAAAAAANRGRLRQYGR